MSLTLLRGGGGGGGTSSGAPIPASRCIQITGVGVRSSGASFPLYTVRNGRKCPYYSDELSRVVAYTGGKSELQAKFVAEFSDVVNKVSTEYEINM